MSLDDDYLDLRAFLKNYPTEREQLDNIWESVCEQEIELTKARVQINSIKAGIATIRALFREVAPP